MRDMHTLNQRQVRAYEARLLALWKTNKILIDMLKAIQGGLLLDDPQQLAIFNRIQMTLERL